MNRWKRELDVLHKRGLQPFDWRCAGLGWVWNSDALDDPNHPHRAWLSQQESAVAVIPDALVVLIGRHPDYIRSSSRSFDSSKEAWQALHEACRK